MEAKKYSQLYENLQNALEKSMNEQATFEENFA